MTSDILNKMYEKRISCGCGDFNHIACIFTGDFKQGLKWT